MKDINYTLDQVIAGKSSKLGKVQYKDIDGVTVNGETVKACKTEKGYYIFDSSKYGVLGFEKVGALKITEQMKAAFKMFYAVAGRTEDGTAKRDAVAHFDYIEIGSNGAFDYEFSDRESGITVKDGYGFTAAKDSDFILNSFNFEVSCKTLKCFYEFEDVEIYRSTGSGLLAMKVAKLADGNGVFSLCGLKLAVTFKETAPETVEAVEAGTKDAETEKAQENEEISAQGISAEAVSGKPLFTIEENAEFGSKEVYFSEKPATSVREALKGLKFRWNGKKGCWYGFAGAGYLSDVINGVFEEVDAEQATQDQEPVAVQRELNSEGVLRADGAEVRPEAETAPEAKETAKRDLSKEFRRGDVVRITGTTNGRNGFFYVVDLHDDGTPYKLQGLKKVSKYDYFKDELTKTVEYWPLHTYASSPKVRAEFKEAVKGARLTNYGPKSVAAYQEVKRQYEETVETLRQWKEDRVHDDYWVNYWTKAEADERADVERMRAEAPELESLKQWKETHQKPEGPGLKIWRHGLKVRQEDGTWKHYSLTIQKAHGYRNDAHAGEIEVYGSYYHGSNEIPGGFGLGIINDSDSQTDYFVADRAFVKPDHPLFWAFAQAAEGGKPYTLTDDDAKRCAEYLEQKRAEAEAKRIAEEEAERAERERKYAEVDRAISDAVETYTEQYPATDGQPTGRIVWSENGVLNAEGSESGKNTVFSLTALDLVMSEADHAKKRVFGDKCGYEKTRMHVDFPDGSTLDERIDIGDGIGGIYENHLHTMKWHTEQALTNREDHNWVEAQKKGLEREARILEMLRPWCDIGGLLVLNDLEALELGETA